LRKDGGRRDQAAAKSSFGAGAFDENREGLLSAAFIRGPAGESL
jgi:hypothetical protein